MLALPLALVLLSASPSTHQGPRETKTQRAARLMTEVELAQLADLDRQVAELSRPDGNTALLVSSVVAMGLGVITPLIAAVIAIVGTVFVGFFGLIGAALGSTTLLALIPQMWVAVFSWIPVWGWVAMGAVVAIGAGMLITAQVSDGPRRAEVSALQVERKRLITGVLERERSMMEAPMTTLATF